MKKENTLDVKPNIASRDWQTEQPNNAAAETPIPDTGSVSASSNDSRKVSREDIELVQNLIERCLQLYMNKDEVVKTLLNRARIDPGFTTLVWQKLEEENADFFRAYYIRLKLKKQIVVFNHLLEHQFRLMKSPPALNGVHPMPVSSFPMGYPVMPHHPMPAAVHPHMVDHTTGHPAFSRHIVNGVPAPANFHPMRMSSGNEMSVGNTAADVSPLMRPNNAMSSPMSDIPVSPTSVASSGHFPFVASEISCIGGVDTSALDTAFTSDVASSVGMQQLPSDNGSRDSLRSLAQIPWNFSLSDLTADLSNLGDLGALGNYPGSPFLPSDSDILLDSPEQEDRVEEFFVDPDSVPGQCLPSDEEKP